MFGVIRSLIYLARALDTPTRKGARGERRVENSITKHFDGTEYKIVTDITLPTDRGTTQIDHVVLCRYGIFVIETKNMSGWIFGDETKSDWTQTHYGRKTKIRNPIHQNYGHINAVQKLLDVKEHLIHGIVAFVGEAEPKTNMPSMVVWDTASLVRKIKAYRVPVFTEKQLDRMMRVLSDPKIVTTREKRQAHIANVNKIAAGFDNLNSPKCPRCGKGMVIRSNKKTGDKFYGCQSFPKCRGSRQL